MDTVSPKRFIPVSIFFFLELVLSACGGKENVMPTVYIPPTPVSALLTASQPAVVYNPPAASAPQCVDNLYYLQDLTIPDGSQVAPGSTLDKQWLVENNGTCNWDHAYRLRLIAGPDMGAPVEQALYPARSGTQAVIRIQFAAPSEAGTYRSAWQAYDPQGIPFGDPIFIEILVQP
ncbi:MAG: hypothetical protein AUK02_04270 [Anaerolineae bacterium CG2_30_58_95]|nr:MAG: hypothetical protein AUK02_04270 [Anaerolineae bacterium CG2_30_58_95]